MTTTAIAPLLAEIRACTMCASHLPAGVRPIVQASATARILIIGQAPGSKVHASGVPWQDDSGNRLLDWLGIDAATLYDATRIAIMPMGFCYPGKGPSADLPPRRECAPLWHERLIAAMPDVRLILPVGAHAQACYLPACRSQTLTRTVASFADMPVPFFPLPHPSWRVPRWKRRNPWFETDVLPAVRARVAEALVVHPDGR